MTDIVPIPEGVNSSEFPTNADRTAGTFNPKVVAWASTTRAQSIRDREIAVATRTNALAGKEAADVAVPAGAAAVEAAAQAVPAAAAAVAARDQAVPAAAAAIDAAARAEYAASTIEDGPVTSVVTPTGVHTGVVELTIADMIAAGDFIGYGATTEEARIRIEAAPGFAISRGSQDYTASQSISKSIFGRATYVLVELWGGAGSGGAAAGPSGSSVAQPPGGEGGSYNSRLVRVADLAANTTLTIGAGGNAVSATSIGTPVFTRGNNGGNSSFAGLVAYGGLASDASAGEAAPSNSAGGANGGAGGGLGALTLSTGSNNRLTSGPGGPSSLGGGGGGGGHIDAPVRVPGAASNAGSGGAGLQATATGQTATSGVVPSGGGGGIRLLASGNVTVTSGAGARGQARLTWW